MMTSAPVADQTARRTIFIIAGEHSGDALGAKLMSGIERLAPGVFQFKGVGGVEMAHEGLVSLFPIEDVAVMGPLNILPALPRIVRRVYQTVDAALAAKPDIVVIIDSPEFTHPIAKRIRKRAPQIPIVDYVSPSVWAWRSGRARKMRAYVDEILGLLPFEPAAHVRLGGPHCTYVGHPLIEKLDIIQQADAAGLRSRLKIAPGRDVLLVLPGSRRSEFERLIDVFGETVARLYNYRQGFDVVIPAVPHLADAIRAKSSAWPARAHVVDSSDKYAAMRLARAALAASGTVTLELAIAGLPMVVAYKVDAMTAAVVRRLVTTDTAVLPNLILGEKAFPEFIQQDCTPEKLSSAVGALMSDTDARRNQLAALARIPGKLELDGTTPSEAAARATLSVLSA
jgi:lipid-A-disaccharide synthase